MRGLWLAALCGCYAPSVASGVPCAPPGSATRCPTNQVCILRDSIEICAPEGSSGDVDASTGSDSASGTWWDTSWTRRRALTVTAGANGAPAGYSIPVVLDHAALVSGGSSLVSGDDVRIVRDSDGQQIDRVLDSGASWNTGSTTIWFKTTASMAANATVRYWIYYGNQSAAAPPQDPMSAFLFADGFEGSTAAWGFDNNVGVSTARAHRGARAIATPPVNEADRGAWIESIDETNIVFDLWWNIDDLTSADLAQYIRGNATSVWMTNLQPPDNGAPSTWDIANFVNDVYSEVVPPPPGSAPPPIDTWFRVTVYAYADTMAVDIEGKRYVPTGGFANIGMSSSGDVGFGAWISQGQVWFDDATVRKLVMPEPTVLLGPQESR